MDTRHEHLWVGIDVGKGYHWAVAINSAGEAVFSRKIPNDETEILKLIATACEAADQVKWAVDLRGKTATLLLVLLAAHGQHITYVPGRSVSRAAEGYRGEGKTDAKDPLIIADMARVRRDFTAIRIPPEQICTLRLLTAHRSDLIADRVRLVNRMRDLLCGISPALENAFDYARSRGAVILLTHYQTPAALRRTGLKRLATWLQRRKVRSAQRLAEKAVEAAEQQHTALPGEARAAALAHQLLALEERIVANDKKEVGSCSARTTARRSSSRYPPWASSSAPSSLPSPETSRPIVTPAAWPRTLAWPRSHATQAAGPATCTGPNATTAACAGSSTSPLRAP